MLQWIHAHLNIEANESEVAFIKEVGNLAQLSSITTLAYANVLAKYIFINQTSRNSLITDFDFFIDIKTTRATLKTNHFKRMKIFSDGARFYIFA